MNVLLRVCKEHKFLTTRHCAYAEQVYDKVRPSCPQVFCKQCIADRQPLMMDDLSTEMGYLLYNNHIYEYLEQNTKDGVNIILHKQAALARHL